MSCNTLFLLLKLGFGIGSEILKKLSEVISFTTPKDVTIFVVCCSRICGAITIYRNGS